MKNLKTYISCLILSILLIFSLIGTSLMITVKVMANKDKCFQLNKENNIIQTISIQLTNYFDDKSKENGIPANIYTDALSDGYLKSVVDIYIISAFNRLEGGKFEAVIPENSQLENNIENFFSDYADSIDYQKDDNYYEKLDETITAAYKKIGEYSDIYKFSTMNNEGLLGKASSVYQHLDLLLIAAAGASLLFILLILIISRKATFETLYWSGISALISGILCIIPCIYLKADKYFDSFVIKQPQIFTSFTSLMYSALNTFLTVQIIIFAFGIVCTTIYTIASKSKRSA